MFSDLIEKLRRRQDLTESEASAAMTEVMEGRAAPAQIAGMLVGLSMKGERPAEVVGFARTMRSHSVHLSEPFDDLFDTCGTGGDRLQTFNVSSLAAVILAACGVRVAKHGNRSVSSTCGSADLFEALGVDVAGSPATVVQCLRDVGIGFLFAPTFHPAMRHAAETRRDLGVRTVFNLLGPLTNPAGARCQIVGVPRPEHTGLLARALGQLGSTRAWVVHGAEGMDEISTTGYTKVAEWRDGAVRTFYVHPSDFGVAVADLEALRVTSRDQSVAIARDLLAGAGGPARDFVLVNAAAGLVVAGRVASLGEGVEAARAALDDGSAARTVEELARVSRHGTS